MPVVLEFLQINLCINGHGCTIMFGITVKTTFSKEIKFFKEEYIWMQHELKDRSSGKGKSNNLKFYRIDQL